MFRRTLLLILAICVLLHGCEAKRTQGRSRSSSSRGTSSRRTNQGQHAAPTSFSNPSPSRTAAGSAAGGSSLFNWQTKHKETPIQQSHTGGTHSQPGQQSHSYPSSHTGLSGNQNPPPYQQHAVQQSHAYPQNSKPQQAHTYPQQHSYPSQNNPGQSHPAQNPNTQSHSYPASGGLSGHSGVGGNYPGQPGAGGGTYAGASAPAYPGGQQKPAYPVGGASGYGNNYHQAAPPPYSNHGYNSPGYSQPGHGGGAHGYGAPGYAAPGYGGYHGYGSPGYGGPGYSHGGYNGYGGLGNFGGYNYNGMSRGTSTLTKVGIAGAGIGTVLTGLALWNLARSGQKHNTYIYQDRRGNPIPVPANTSAPAVDPILGELVNCTLTIRGADSTEVIGIPCAIATSFSPNSNADKDFNKDGSGQEAQCIVTVVTKNGTEFSTTIPCSIFLNTAKEAKVTEPPPLAPNGTDTQPLGPPIPVGQAPPLPPIPNNPQDFNNSQGFYNPQGYNNPQDINNSQGFNPQIYNNPQGYNPQGMNNPQGINNPQGMNNPQSINNPQGLGLPLGVPLAPYPDGSQFANENKPILPSNLNPVGVPLASETSVNNATATAAAAAA